MISDKSVVTGMELLGRIVTGVNGANMSLVDASQSARVEPPVMVDMACTMHENLHDVLQTLNNLFAAYYLQAVQVTQAEVNGVRVVDILDKYNPNRRPRYGKAVDRAMDYAENHFSGESYTDTLLPENYVNGLPSMESFRSTALEGTTGDGFMDRVLKIKPIKDAKKAENADKAREIHEQEEEIRRQKEAGTYIRPYEPEESSVGFGGKSIDQITARSDLGVGKLLAVSLKSGCRTEEVTVAVRLQVMVASSRVLSAFMSQDELKLTADERSWAMKVGTLKFWRDIVFTKDLIDETKRRAVYDKDGLWSAMNGKRQDHQIASLLSGEISVAAITAMMVISSATRQEIEFATGLSFDRPADRRKIFDRTSLMIVAEMNEDYNRVIFYTRGIEATSSLSYRDLRSAAGKDGPNVSDILKAYSLGHAPSL